LIQEQYLLIDQAASQEDCSCDRESVCKSVCSTPSPTYLDSPDFNDDTLSIAAQLAADESNHYYSAFKMISSSLPLAPYSDQLTPHVQKLFPPHIPYNNDLTHSTPTTNYSHVPYTFFTSQHILTALRKMQKALLLAHSQTLDVYAMILHYILIKILIPIISFTPF
jgi:hypothetical protein